MYDRELQKNPKVAFTSLAVLDRREMLRVKIKSLAAEAKLIRQEERRTHGAIREELYVHRRFALRIEARAALRAHMLIRGKSIQEAEPNARPLPEVYEDLLMEKALNMVRKYGSAERYREVKAAIEAAHPEAQTSA